MKEGHELKSALLTHARTDIEQSLTTTQEALARLEESLASETKSSAGDKFETGRAMLHLEQQKLARQVSTSIERLEAVARITAKKPTDLIAEGNLVATNRGLYLLGLGLGKVKLNGRTVFSTSLNSPIGRALLGKTVGDSFTFNDLTFEVLGMV